MSLKSKRTTADKDPNGDYPEKRDLESGNGLEPKILFSSSKMLKKLSLSFYGEDTMRKQKQVIYDQE